MGSIGSIPSIVEERAIYFHQRASHFYRPLAYFLSGVAFDIPVSSLETIVFATLVYYMTGMFRGSVLSFFALFRFDWIGLTRRQGAVLYNCDICVICDHFDSYEFGISSGELWN